MRDFLEHLIWGTVAVFLIGMYVGLSLETLIKSLLHLIPR